jgi:pseudaminic acid synthase
VFKLKTFIVAELSANHNHNFDVAIRTIRAAKESGADAVKLQTYTADVMTIDCDNDYFRIKQGTLWDGMTLYELYKQAYTTLGMAQGIIRIHP